MKKNYVFEQVIYEREHLSHDMFAQMDWERDSIMREIENRRYLPEGRNVKSES